MRMQGKAFVVSSAQATPQGKLESVHMNATHMLLQTKICLNFLFIFNVFPRLLRVHVNIFQISPDFFDYFAATAPLLEDPDENLLAVSAWNDNGQVRRDNSLPLFPHLIQFGSISRYLSCLFSHLSHLGLLSSSTSLYFRLPTCLPHCQDRHVSDARAVYRSSFFPGLGWMMTSQLWQELGPKWPQAYWDDWLREPPQQVSSVSCSLFHSTRR